ncbi:hypothetical protein [Erysipelothrix aquatica]|uniref:hypothetical protein n=1 Tax=Erysipelothrix aquatica TaxID=2683714 RepID=UPI00135A18EA|nr:hypothetical protein [Erysipelothrix aquatica]
MAKTEETMFIDFFNKNVYLVPKDKEALAKVFQSRFAITLALAVVVNGLFFDTPASLVFGLATLIIMEIIYRKRFLQGLTIVPKERFVMNDNLKPQALMMNIGLYALFGVLLTYYALTGVSQDASKWGLLALGVGSLGLSGTYLLTYLSSK